MALNIKNKEADELARRLAAAMGESITDAVVVALKERLERETARRGPGTAVRLQRLAEQVAALPVVDDRPLDQLLSYDRHGLPA